jgi:hypothetical protein
MLDEIYRIRSQVLDELQHGVLKTMFAKMMDEFHEQAYMSKLSCQSGFLAVNAPANVAADQSGLPGFAVSQSITQLDPSDGKGANKYIQLLTYIQMNMRTKKIRRREDRVYMRKRNAANYATAAWTEIGTLEQFMYDVCRKSENPRMWAIAAQPTDPIASAAKYFLSTGDPDCPEIIRTKWLFSFENGLYDALTNSFTTYNEAADAAFLNSDSVPAKHFDGVQFDEAMWETTKGEGILGAWKDIPTDAIDGLFSYQDIDREAIDWMYITVGRLLHHVGELDNFGYVGMIVGAAGTGKSTFCLHLAKLWEPDDVGVLSNNCERQWAIGVFVDKFLVIAPEIKSDLRLDQAEWQGMTTGDPMSVARKHRDARTVKWKVPAFFSGNQMPDWVDHGGSVLRRILLWRFEKKVKREDGGLPKKLEEELPNFILKCAVAYKEQVSNKTAKFGACANLWETVPEYFKEQRRTLSAMLNPLESFISDKIIKGEDFNVPLDEFKRNLVEYCKENSFGTYKMSGDNYKTVFNEHGFKVMVIQYQGNTSSYRATNCVTGCRMKNDSDNMTAADVADIDSDSD